MIFIPPQIIAQQIVSVLSKQGAESVEVSQIFYQLGYQ